VGALHRASAPCPSPGVSRAFSPGDEPASASPVADGWLGNTRGPVGQPRGCVPPTPSSHACHRAGAEETNNPCPQGRGQLRRCGGRCVRGSGTDARVAVRRFTACAHLWWVSDCWRNGADRLVSKMQARSVDPAAETDRKVSRRCRRVKGRIEKQASIGMDSGRAPERGGRWYLDVVKMGSAVLDIRVPQGRGHLRSRSLSNHDQEKPAPDKPCVRTKTEEFEIAEGEANET
jgi:hypothetical protein